jgi:hypothetical protein
VRRATELHRPRGGANRRLIPAHGLLWGGLWLLLPVLALAQPAASGAPARTVFGGYLIASGYFDDNVFDYSAVNRSIIGTPADTSGRFPISSVGDFITELSARVDCVRKAPGRKRDNWRARLRYDGHLYANNTFRNYHQFGAELRRDVGRTYVEVTGLYLPEYYLRELYWRPMPSRPPGVRYAPARYAKYSFALETGTRLQRTLDGHIWWAWDRRDYEAPFDERDNHSNEWGAALAWKATDRVEAQIHGGYATVAAAGAQATDSLIADISNRQYFGRALLDLQLDAAGRFRLTPSFYYEQQEYTTDNRYDVSHYNRRDEEMSLDVHLTWRASSHWQPRLFYEYRRGTSTAKLATDVGEYTGNQIGLQVIYYY